MLKLTTQYMASMNYSDSGMYKKNGTNTVVYVDGKGGNLYLPLREMLHTIYAVKIEQTIIHQHVVLGWESKSYWWSIRSNIYVLARFNCASHIYEFLIYLLFLMNIDVSNVKNRVTNFIFMILSSVLNVCIVWYVNLSK